MTDGAKSAAVEAIRRLANAASDIDSAVSDHRYLERLGPSRPNLVSGAAPIADDPVRGPLRGEEFVEALHQALDYRLRDE